MHETYRGHEITLVKAEDWCALMLEKASGAVLPTKASATRAEGREICVRRARRLVDLYLEPADRKRPTLVSGPVQSPVEPRNGFSF